MTQIFVDDAATFGPLTTSQAQTAVNAVRAFWFAVNQYLPNEITLTTSTTVDLYDPVTGALTGSVVAPTAPATVAGTDTGSYSMAAGLRVALQTGVIRNGRRVRGAIYIVPGAAAAMSALGTVGSTPRTTINTAGATMLSSLASGGLRLLVYSRPVPAGEPNGPRVGDVAQVSAVETSEKGAVLRGRRD